MANPNVNIALIGPGLVGKEFLRQIKGKFNVIAVTSSSKMSFSDDISENTVPANMNEFLNHCAARKPCIVVDSTSNQKIADMYPEILKCGLHIVTPNKKAFSGSMDLYKSIYTESKLSNVSVKHESTVG